jgi:hypothetical protein
VEGGRCCTLMSDSGVGVKMTEAELGNMCLNICLRQRIAECVQEPRKELVRHVMNVYIVTRRFRIELAMFS